MTPDLQQALALLDQVLSTAPVNRATHIAAQQALEKVTAALMPSVGSGDPPVETKA